MTEFPPTVSEPPSVVDSQEVDDEQWAADELFFRRVAWPFPV